MTFVATAMNTLFDALTAPFGAHAGAALLVLSVLVGVVMLLLFKVSTNQERLVAAREVLTGRLYELGLYQDHLGVLVRIMRDLTVANLRYLRWSLPALAVMIVPMVLILAQLDARYAHRPLRPGETALVRVQLDEAARGRVDGLELQAPPGLAVDSRPVRDRAAGRAVWRVRATAPGDHDLAVRLDGDAVAAKRLPVGPGAPRLAAVRERESLRRTLLNPAEPPLPGGGPVASVAAELPARDLVYAGLRLHWLVALAVFSLLAGFALKDAFRVRL